MNKQEFLVFKETSIRKGLVLQINFINYYLTEAYVSDDGKKYIAYAYTGEGDTFGEIDKYQVIWDTTDNWRVQEEEMAVRIRNGEDEHEVRLDYPIFDDESNACDWENPIDLKQV